MTAMYSGFWTIARWGWIAAVVFFVYDAGLQIGWVNRNVWFSEKSKKCLEKFKKSIDKAPMHWYNTQAVWQHNQIWGYSSAGRALEWHSRGQRFDPAYLHQRILKTTGFRDFFFAKMAVLPLKYRFSKPRFLTVPFAELLCHHFATILPQWHFVYWVYCVLLS